MHLISRSRLPNRILWVWHIFTHAQICQHYFSLRAMCWYHDGAERVLGSKSLGNELFWTTVNVLVVSPVVQRFNNCMCYEQIIKYLRFIE